MYIKLTSFLVVGLKNSGYSISKLLLNKGAEVYIYDNVLEGFTKKNALELEGLNAKITYNPLETLNLVDVLVLSPGVPIDNEIAIEARRLNKRIIGELELSSYFITAPIIAVTGTNGKTTVCSMLSQILDSVNEENFLLGNIGTPLSSKVNEITNDSIVITEVSSFQLETVSRFCPHISCILNIAPDHLERHYNMENYVFLKSKLIQNLKESEFAVLNYDDENVKSIHNNTKGKVIWFSKTQKVNGAYLEGENLIFNDEVVINTSQINLIGKHNIENVLAVITILKLIGLENSEICSGINSFKGIKHRIEEVKTVNDVTFYNDSKSTNPDSTIKAINSINVPTVLIMGGYEKGLDYSSVMNEVNNSQNITNIVFTGMSAKNMYDTAINCGVKNANIVTDFNSCIKFAYMLAKKGGAVLFSPSTSSFDIFSSYEERGEKFIEAVNQL